MLLNACLSLPSESGLSSVPNYFSEKLLDLNLNSLVNVKLALLNCKKGRSAILQRNKRASVSPPISPSQSSKP